MAKRRPTALHPDDPRGSTTPAPRPLTPSALTKRLARFNASLPAIKASIYARPEFDARYALDTLQEQADRYAAALTAAYRDLAAYYSRKAPLPDLPTPFTETAAFAWRTACSPYLRQQSDLQTLVRQMARLTTLRSRLASYDEAMSLAQLQNLADALTCLTPFLPYVSTLLAEKAALRHAGESRRKDGGVLRAIMAAHPRTRGETTNAYATRLAGIAVSQPALRSRPLEAVIQQFRRLLQPTPKPRRRRKSVGKASTK